MSSGGPEREATHLLFRFAGFSYLVWMLGSGYFRFQLPLEALAPILLLLILERLTVPGRLRQLGGAVLLLAALFAGFAAGIFAPRGHLRETVSRDAHVASGSGWTPAGRAAIYHGWS